jgi:Holliday junction resolvase RusA-like endonuclease
MEDKFGALLLEITEDDLNAVQDDLYKPRNLHIRSAPRMTQGGKGKPDNVNYAQYKFAIRQVCAVKQFNLPKRPVHIVFSLPAAKDIEKRIAQPPQFMLWDGQQFVPVGEDRHEHKPDTDNLMKAFYDAMRESDQDVHIMLASKHWGRQGYIRVYALSDRALLEIYSQK